MRTVRLLLPVLMACLASLFNTIRVMAIPALPAAFYGEVQINSANVPDGTLIRASINGHVYAEGYTQTFNDVSVYSLNVPADDTGTAQIEGGREGDLVQFEIGGITTEQSGKWQSAANVRLDLSARAAEPLSEPQATPSPIPTQTAIVSVQPSSTRADSVQFIPSNTPIALPLIATGTEQVFSPTNTTTPVSQKLAVAKEPLPTFTLVLLSSATPISSADSKQEKSHSSIPAVALTAGIIVLGGAISIIRKKMHIDQESNVSTHHKQQGGSK